jgi:hypothetical protein
MAVSNWLERDVIFQHDKSRPDVVKAACSLYSPDRAAVFERLIEKARGTKGCISVRGYEGVN